MTSTDRSTCTNINANKDWAIGQRPRKMPLAGVPEASWFIVHATLKAGLRKQDNPNQATPRNRSFLHFLSRFAAHLCGQTHVSERKAFVKAKMKMLLAMAMVVSMAAWAQRGPPPSAEEMVQRMTEHLGLSADQQVALRDLLEQNRPEPGTDPEAGRAAVDAGLESILTAEQLESFRMARQSRGDRPPGGPGQGHGGRQ